MNEHELETHDSLVSNKTHSVLTNHPLTAFIMKKTPLIILSNIKVDGWLNDESAALETLDEYLRNPEHFHGLCYFLASESRLFYNLLLKIDKLQHTIYMMQFFPHKVQNNTLHITKAEYLENILELYIVNNLGMHDRILELVNLLYDLKVPKNTLRKKDLVIDKLDNLHLLKELRLLDQVLSDIRKARNVVVHEASYYNEELENIFQQEIRFRELREKTNDKKLIASRSKEIEKHYDTFIADKTMDLYMNDSILTKILKNIFDELYKQHKKRLKQYGYKSSSSQQKPDSSKQHHNQENGSRSSLREQASFHSLEFTDVMHAVDLSSDLNPKDAGNYHP